MKILNGRTGGGLALSRRDRRGAALLLSLLLLLILVAIVIQINVSTSTDARVARNDVTMTTMDLAIESAMLQELETLKADGEADSGAAGAPGGSSGAGAGIPGASTAGGASGAGGAPGAQAQPCDSRRDEWATPQRTELNNIRLRIIVQDENSKYNILNMLNPDEKEADEAFERVVRILDACREGTNYDIDQRTAEEMAKAWRETFTKRRQAKLARPKLLTDDEKDEDRSMPLSLREVMPLQPFEDHHFRDFRDEEGHVVHSIGTFLTVWSSVQTAPAKAAPGGTGAAATAGGASGAKSGASSSSSAGKSGSSSSSSSSSSSASAGKSGTSGSGTAGSSGAAGSGAASGASGSGAAGTGANGSTTAGGANAAGAGSAGASTSFGYGVNVNTAPAAVLKSLVDGRIVSGRFWDKVIEYRNLEDEEEKKKQEEEARKSGTTATQEEEQLDEYGQPVIKRRIFETLSELSEVDGYSDISGENQNKLQAMLGTQSEVFSIYIIARKATTGDASTEFSMSPAEQRKHEETSGDSLTRVVHAVYWRQNGSDGVTLTPILRWEVLDYVPYEVLDYPPDDR